MRKNVIIALVLIYIPLIYFGATSEQFASDEFFYMQMAKAIVGGRMPYRDFFYAHPPLMIFPIALSYLIFGVSIAAAKLIPLVSSFIVLVFVYLIGERIQKNAGILACLLLLLSQDFHSYSHNAVGLFLSLVFVLGSVHFYLNKRPFLSGLFIALALFVRLNTVAFFMVMLFLNHKQRRFYLGALACAPLLLFIFVPNFIDNVVLYHLSKEARPFSNSIASLATFAGKNWFILILASVGLSKIKELKIERALVLLPVFSVVFTLLLGTIYDFYFFLALPFFALLGAISIEQIIGKRNDIIAVFLVVALVSSLSGIVGSYRSIVWVDDIIEYIEDNTSPDDSVLYVGGGNAYVAMKTGRDISGDFIDISEQRFYVYNKTINDELLDALKESKVAVFDYKDLNVYSRYMGVDFGKLKGYLRRNFHPVTYLHTYHQTEGRSWWSETNLLMVWALNEEEGLGVREPEGVRERYYLESYYYLQRNTTPQERFKVTSRNQSSSEPYLPEFLLGKNAYEMKFIAKNIVKWPLTSRSHYSISEEDVTSDVWVGEIDDNAVRLLVETYTKDDTISFSELTYNITEDSFTTIRVLSRYSEGMLIGYLPTYRQVEISKEEYTQLSKQL